MTSQAITLLSLLSIVLNGGLLAVLLRYVVQMRKLKIDHELALRDDHRVDFSTVLEVIERQRNDLIEQNRVLNQRIEHLEAETQGLRIARDLDPFPSWLVDLEGRYSYVNRPFEECFLEPKKQTFKDAIGKMHTDLWPVDFCHTLAALDTAARKRPDGTARANTTVDVPGLGTCEVTIHKFPCRVRGVIVAYAGYITSIEPVSEKLAV